MKKFLCEFDWYRAVYFLVNTMQKQGNIMQKERNIMQIYQRMKNCDWANKNRNLFIYLLSATICWWEACILLKLPPFWCN